MASTFQKSNLAADEFAFHFSSKRGIEARELGRFLQRSATVARREGAEIRVVAVEDGSLVVRLKALAASVGKEFSETPIKTTAASTVLVTAVTTAIVWAMSPSSDHVSPMAKAGAELVERNDCTKIELVTRNDITLIMDEVRAEEVRRLEHLRKGSDILAPPRRELEAPQRIMQLVDRAKAGQLSGGTASIGGELHFRPDGFRFWVPIDMENSDARDDLFANAHYTISGEILVRDRQPDSVLIHRAKRV